MNVQAEHGNEAKAQHPQHSSFWQKAIGDRAQAVVVFGDGDLTFLQVEDADHIDNNKSDQAEAGETHHPLLANGSLVEI